MPSTWSHEKLPRHWIYWMQGGSPVCKNHHYKQPWNMAWRLVCVFQSQFLVKLEIPRSAFTTLMAFLYLWSWKSIHSPAELPGPCPAATPKTTTRQRSRVQCQCRRCPCRVGGALVRTSRTWPWKMLGTSEPYEETRRYHGKIITDPWFPVDFPSN